MIDTMYKSNFHLYNFSFFKWMLSNILYRFPSILSIEEGYTYRWLY